MTTRPVKVEKILTTAQRIAKSAQRVATQITGLADTLARLDAADYITHRSKFNQIVLTYSQSLTLANYKLSVLTKLFDLLAKQSDEAGESATDLAELTADNVMINEDDHRLTYLLLAQQIADLHPYLFDKALNEVARWPGGWSQIQSLDAAIKRVVKGD